MYNIHESLKHKLDHYIKHKQVPNILFYGESGTGKLYLLNYLLKQLYNIEERKRRILYVNCAIDKGIHYVRNELKLFAKMNPGYSDGTFKSIILLHADKLTIDAQSALRRCIEIFARHTRFFIIVKNKNALLHPIVSRFSTLYVPYPIIRKRKTNLHKLLPVIKQKYVPLDSYIKKDISTIECSENMYNDGVTCMDIIDYIKNNMKDDENKYSLLINIDHNRQYIRSEKMCMYISLHYLFRYMKHQTI
jgi:DNA polymerase III delta prime subunit